MINESNAAFRPNKRRSTVAFKDNEERPHEEGRDFREHVDTSPCSRDSFHVFHCLQGMYQFLYVADQTCLIWTAPLNPVPFFSPSPPPTHSLCLPHSPPLHYVQSLNSFRSSQPGLYFLGVGENLLQPENSTFLLNCYSPFSCPTSLHMPG